MAWHGMARGPALASRAGLPHGGMIVVLSCLGKSIGDAIRASSTARHCHQRRSFREISAKAEAGLHHCRQASARSSRPRQVWTGLVRPSTDSSEPYDEDLPGRRLHPGRSRQPRSITTGPSAAPSYSKLLVPSSTSAALPPCSSWILRLWMRPPWSETSS